MIRQLEEAITLAATPKARKTVRTMLETYRLIIESRCRNDFVSILLEASEKKQTTDREGGVK